MNKFLIYTRINKRGGQEKIGIFWEVLSEVLGHAALFLTGQNIENIYFKVIANKEKHIGSYAQNSSLFELVKNSFPNIQSIL